MSERLVEDIAFVRIVDGKVQLPEGLTDDQRARMLARLDESREERVSRVVKQRIENLLKAPPGPPPRKGLVWYEPTNRWRKPKNVEGEEKYKWVRDWKSHEGIDWIQPKVSVTATGRTQQQTLIGQPVPPAWRHAAINSDPRGMVQAVGLDSKDRVVQIMHPRHDAERADAKFARQREFAKVLPAFRRQFERDFDLKDEARVLHAIDKTGFRIGTNLGTDNLGITTLKVSNVSVKGSDVTFDFQGKHGVRNHKTVRSAKLARFVRQRKQEGKADDQLFIASAQQVRRYMRRSGLQGFQPKDFRTHQATVLASTLVKEYDKPKTAKELEAVKNSVGDRVASWLQNTRKVALGSYVSPRVFTALERGLQKAEVDWRQMWRPTYDRAVEEQEDGTLVYLPYADEDDEVDPR